MPVDVPKDDKVYTKVYNIDKGVDYTNDPSNVYVRRSPMGKNMLPDLDNKPFKRKGWEIKLTPEDFNDAAGVSGVTIVPDKVHYFEVGGYDYLMFFNNLGVFAYTTIGEKEELWHCSQYVDTTGALADFSDIMTNVLPDPQRAFFFEGRGDAGFYIFIGLKMFVFTGEYETIGGVGGRFFHEVEPYIPTIFIGCDQYGIGTELENVNMLTRFRIVQYFCDGKDVPDPDDPDATIRTGTSVFNVPGGFVSDTLKVEIRDPDNGDWKLAVAGTDYTASDGVISFTEAPLVVVEGEDNLKVTYEPDGTGASATENTITSESKIISVKKVRHRKRTRKGPKGNPTAWETTSTTYELGSDNFDTANIKTNEATGARYLDVYCRNATNTGWISFNDKYYSKSFDPYKPTVNVKATKALFSATDVGSEEGKYYRKDDYGKWSPSVSSSSTKIQTQKLTVTEIKYFRVRVGYTSYKYSGGTDGDSEAKTAFSQCSRVLVYGSGIINQVFFTASPYQNYNTRVWYSGATNPKYFPELNYIEVGATDTPIMGLIKVGEYLGIIKQGASIDTSIYLAYPTSFEENTTYAVKQNVGGIGAVANGAFNILKGEPLFFSKEGIMAIEVSSEETDRHVRNRSYYVNKKLCSEDNLAQAISFVHDGMYYLAINGRCYVLDGNQKTSWANERTNLQYEAYYLDNIPAQCFCRFHDEMWFTDFLGNVCRFKTDSDEKPYHDDYHVDGAQFTASFAPTDLTYYTDDLDGDGTPAAGDFITYGDTWYTVESVVGKVVYVGEGVAIDAIWSTIADDDGMVHFFKNLQKKGVVVSLMPSSDSGVEVYIKADSNDPILVGKTDATDYTLPYDVYLKKKIKKYKRLQFICRNNVVDDSFGLDQIIKSYTVGNYSKNKG